MPTSWFVALPYALRYALPQMSAAAAAGYLIGSIPFAYVIVCAVTGEDLSRHGTGNVGAMNVRRSTGSWAWFLLAMLLDGLKGFAPTAAAKLLVGIPLLVPTSIALVGARGTQAEGIALPGVPLATAAFVVETAVFGAVLGHNYSIWMALIHRRFERTGKGLATGGGALLAYDWRYFVAVLVVGLAVIALTRYMMAGQVAAAATLPLAAIVLRSPDWPFALLMAILVYTAHHKRFVGLLRGTEPRLYVDEGSGPRG